MGVSTSFLYIFIVFLPFLKDFQSILGHKGKFKDSESEFIGGHGWKELNVAEQWKCNIFYLSRL